MRKFKRTIFFLLFLCVTSSVYAETGFTMEMLKENVRENPRWIATYEAHGRTIEVDIPIIIPDVDCIPITEVSSYPLFESQDFEDTSRFIEFEGRNDERSFEDMKLNATIIVPTLFDSVQIQADSPGDKISFSNTKESKEYLKYERSVYYPWELDDFYTVYAEENEMSLGEAYDFIEETIDLLYGESDGIAINYIEVRNRARKTNNINDYHLGDVVDYYPSGTYYIHLCQKMNGVPVYAYPFQIFDPYKLAEGKLYDDPYMPLNCLYITAEVMNRESFFMFITLMKKQSVINEDPYFVPVSTVISAIEKEIEEGRVRNVYALRLGYVCYLSRNSDTLYTLYPTWICECDYAQTAEEAGSTYFEGEGFHEGSKFALIGINAVTGELFDRRYPSQDLIYCPHSNE